MAASRVSRDFLIVFALGFFHTNIGFNVADFVAVATVAVFLTASFALSVSADHFASAAATSVVCARFRQASVVVYTDLAGGTM